MSRRLARRSFTYSAARAVICLLAGGLTAVAVYPIDDAPQRESSTFVRPVHDEAPVRVVELETETVATSFDPCSDMLALHEGRGAPDRQHWFNHLTYQDYARFWIACVHGWGEGEWRCLVALWNHESGWNPTIANRQGSSAYGIPQALPGTKMASHGDDWRTNGRTQVRWGTRYIDDRYGAPSGTGCRGPY